MTRPPKDDTPNAGAAEPSGDVHRIDLSGITRDYDTGFEAEIYTVDFDSTGPEGETTASVEVAVAETTTTEIVPTAMGRLHALFAALARQTEAWGRNRGEGKP